MRRGDLAVAFLVALAAGARGEDDVHAGCAPGAVVGSVPREIVERPSRLRSGTGNARERVTTASPEAQAFYDQGLDYVHGYVWIEAARSFRQALRHDPKLAMAELGLSRAYSGLGAPDDAKTALGRAQALAGAASAREQRRIALRAQQLDAIASPAAGHAEYKKALDEALERDPRDVELWLLRGNAEEPHPGGRGQRGGIASTAFYRSALGVAPRNAAAHHYLTHSYEMVGQIDEALAHGEAYARLAPAIPHAHHMWGHDLRRVGRVDDAIAAFEKTRRLEREYYEAENVPAEYDWHHSHNLSLLATAYQHRGSVRRAEEVVREIMALRPFTPNVSYERKDLTLFLLHRGRFDEALEAARALGGGAGDSAQRALARTLAGEALLALGRVEAARDELAAAENEADAGAVERFVDALRGQLQLRSPDTVEEGRRRLEELAGRLRSTPGADAWITALFRLEAMARAARDADDWVLAERLARELLEHDPRYAGSHLAMALVARRLGDGASARKNAREGERLWRRADRDFPERRVLQALRAGKSPSASF